MTQRRTVQEIYAAAEEKIARARDRRATRLHLGERLRSLRQIPSLAGLSFLRSLTLSETGISDLSPLADVPQLNYLNLSRISPLWDISPLPKLKELVSLDLSYTSVANLSALTELKNLKTLDLRGSAIIDVRPLAYLSNLESLYLGHSSIRDITPLQHLSKLKDLNLSNAPIIDVRPLANLPNLQILSLNTTRVENISSLANLGKLQGLDLDSSQIADLLPLAEMRSLINGARSPHYFRMPGDVIPSGLSFSDCPLSDPDLLRLSRIGDDFRRTVDTIAHLRRRRGLPPLTNSELSEEKIEPKDHDKFSRLRPVDNVPSPFGFQLSTNGNIALVESFSNLPTFPNTTSELHHADRLDACRVLAGDLISELDSKRFQVRFEYSEMLQRYQSRLPVGPNKGNILLADAEARTLRNLFYAEAEILSPPLASKLKTFLEQHMGLRVFYPEITHFYRDVQSGRIDIPLPLDAVDAFVREVRAGTPNVFDESVTSAIEGSAEPAAIFPESLIRGPPQEQTQPSPPRDPLGEIDAKKSRDFTVAGAANGLWKAFLEGQKIHKAMEGWKSTGEALYPHASKIIEWLRHFLSSGDGAPPMPPTLGI